MHTCQDHTTLLPSHVAGKEIIMPSFILKPSQWEEPLRAMNRLESKQFGNIDAAIQRPALIDIHDSRPHSLPFTSDFPDSGIRHENVPHLHMSTPCEVDHAVINLSSLSDLIGIKALRSHMNPLIQLDTELESHKQLFDFFRDLGRSSHITVQRDGQVLFCGTETEMKDLVAFVAEYYLANSSTKWRTQSVLIPHFDRLDSTQAWVSMGQSSILEAARVAPLKRPEKVKRKQSNKRENIKKAARERDLYRRNYFHACESLLSLILNKSQSRKMAILSLKNFGPEIPELLIQFSAGIAGTGLAVLFSVMCKVANGQIPLCASKLISTGFGFGLIWLASAVNKLRDTILYISKNASKMSFDEEEMARRVDKSTKEIFFRAAALMAVALLRFA